MGAAASKKCKLPQPRSFLINSAIASEVRGPVAITVTVPSSREETSSSTTSILGWLRMRSVIYCENLVRSTANADPAGTRVASAACIIKESKRRISSLRSPTALEIQSERKELEHTSSANPSEWCAGVILRGFISKSLTLTPRCAACQAASQPASPAP